MATGVLTAHRRRNRLQTVLHLFYAGLFAFVLPLICWGAQATPGHPHARAHFVFVDPILVADEPDRTVEHAAHPEPMTHSAPQGQHQTHQQPAPSAKMPAGRSTPSMLGIVVLTLIGLSAAVAPLWNPGPRFFCWLAPLWVMPLTIAIPTPPPRCTFHAH